MNNPIDYSTFDLDCWVAYIQHQHWRTMDMTLDRIRQVWERMDGRLSGFSIIVGGTNGKGSTISMLEAGFNACGISTGSYTSPHLLRYNERIKLSGKEVSDQLICQTFCEIEYARGDVPLTYFEYGTLCALRIFQNQSVEVCLLEVGMGGRLDAVNMIDGDVAIITSIGIDHEQWLGSDREKIAVEKAGIMRAGKPVICADPNPPQNIEIEAKKVDALLLKSAVDFDIIEVDDQLQWRSTHPRLSGGQFIQPLAEPFSGMHQRTNLSGAMAALSWASMELGFDINRAAAGIASSKITARCQILSTSPLQVIDVAHNEDSARELGRFLQRNPVAGKTIAVLGVLEDKILSPILTPIHPQVDEWMLASLPGERGQSSERLAEKLYAFDAQSRFHCFGTPTKAYQAGLSRSNPEDRVVIFGSFYTVGDIIGCLKFAP